MSSDMPLAFKKACRNLGQDLSLRVSRMQQPAAQQMLVATALIGLDRNDAQNIRSYIADLLSRNLAPEQLNEIWHATPSEVHFGQSAHIVDFLRALSERLAEKPYVDGHLPD